MNAHKQVKSNKAKRRYALVVIAVVSLACICGFLYTKRVHFMRPTIELDPVRYPVRGIDVSKHNGRVDFTRVASAGYAFAILKATEGAMIVDPKFEDNYHAARRAGMRVGAYHFFRKKVDGKQQATNMLRALQGKHIDLPVTIDIEDWGNDYLVDDRVIITRLQAMIDMLKAKGYRVMLYTNGKGYNKWIKPSFAIHDLWLCSFRHPDSLSEHGHVIQQYSHWGSVPGIQGDVDLNVFIGSREQWEQFLN